MNKYQKKNIIKEAGVLLVISFIVLSVSSTATPTNNTTPSIRGEGINNYENIGRLDDVVWENGEPATALVASQLDTSYPFNAQTADDFMLDEEVQITAVGWYGGFWNGPPDEINPCDFNIYFYEDDGTGDAPTGGGTQNPETTAVASYNFADIEGVSIGEAAFSYEVALDPVFVPEVDTKYWIAIQAVFNYAPQWGWFNTDNPVQLIGAVQGFPLLELPFWTPTEYGDQAYYLLGTEYGGGSEDTELEIVNISGGLGVSATVKNVGENNATDVEIVLKVTGGILGMVNKSVPVSVGKLAADAEEIVSSGLFFGLGPIDINVTAVAANADEVTESKSGFILVLFVLGVD